ncbi:VCBS repeat-containing protein [Streptomyces sp. NPDC089919]|uniref:FG-GAP repeat domain-containing protein n=1 Tax=Streptomyces sp. NPDC089919 TaxID=3155188 RepID=UPI0034392A9D
MSQTTSRGSRSRRPLAILLALAFPAAALTALAPAVAAAPTTEPAAEADGQIASASEAEAFGLAAKTGHRIEIVDRREESVETFANPDGSMTRRQYTRPVWTRSDLTWRKTDPTVERREDGSLGPKATTFDITFSTGGTTPLVTMKDNGKSLSLKWPTALPEPVVEGNTALYKSVLPDVDLTLTADVDGFAQHLLVKTPQAAANPALKNIKLGIESHGVTLDDTAGDVLLAKDDQGNVLFKAPQPKMWEQPAATPEAAQRDGAAKTAAQSKTTTAKTASYTTTKVVLSPAADAAPTGQPESAPVATDVTGSTLTLTPDADLMATADQFPLVIDPVFSGGGTDGWAVIYSATPNDDYPNGIGWKSDNPADEPRVGYNGSGNTSSFFAMDTSGLYGATITSVTFAVAETHSWGCDASAAGPTELWSSKKLSPVPTWSTQDKYWGSKLDSASYAHGNPIYCPGVEGHDYKSTALTNYVQQAADEGWDPLVLGLRTPDSYRGNVNSFKRFQNNPNLEITYNFKPEVLDADAFEGTWTPGGDGNKPVACGATIGNSGLALTARLRDKDGGTVTPEFVVTNSSGASVPVSYATKVASGQTATATVLAKNLTSGTYKWKVRATDGEGPASAYTADCSFTVDRIGPKNNVDVWTEDGDPIPAAARFKARTTVRLKLHNPAGDLAGFCWAMDRPLSVSSTRCSNGNWVPVGSSGYTAYIDVVPTGKPSSTLYVLAYDQAGNHSPTDGDEDTTTLRTSPPDYIYEPGITPNTPGVYPHDRLGDLDGDGHADMLATDTLGRLRLYSGDGTGKVDASVFVGTSGWGSALIAHGGDFANFASSTSAPDGYEDVLARLSDGNAYMYGSNGRGEPMYLTRRLLAPPSSSANAGGWKSVRQMILPGDLDKRTSSDYTNGNDLVTVQCVDTGCTDAKVILYSGKTAADGGANQATPFDFDVKEDNVIGSGTAWLNRTILGTGDQDGDGLGDILARDDDSHQLILFHGQKSSSGAYGLDFDNRVIYGTGGWHKANRPLLTSAGNVQGSVKTKSVSLDGVTTYFKQFVPTAGESAGDLWATTAADPDLVVPYVKDDGTAASTTCPTGCLLFYPGGETTHRSPRLVGTGSWTTTITGIF